MKFDAISVRNGLLAVLLGFGASVASAQDPENSLTYGIKVCTEQEAWLYTKAIRTTWYEEFRSVLDQAKKPIMGLGRAFVLESRGKSPEVKLFGVYWKNRIFMEAGMIHTAVSGFNKLAAMPVRKKTVGIQLAALECLNQIHYKHPRLHLSETVAKNLGKYRRGVGLLPAEGFNKDIVEEALGIWIRVMISNGESRNSIQPYLNQLSKNGAHYALSDGLLYAREENFGAAIKTLLKFFKLPRSASVRRYEDGARLTLARSFYKVEQYKKSAVEFKRVNKDSNEMVRVLSELSWVYLMDKNYGESVGTATSLQLGGLRNTFSPAGIMVMAMALNELCQYPSALRTVRFFRKHYRGTYEWLRNWYLKRKESSSGGNYYPKVVNFLKGKKIDVPKNVVMEWVRSPIFLSLQEEMNLFIDERNNAIKMVKAQKADLKEYRSDLAELNRRVKEEYKDAKRSGNIGRNLASGLREDMVLLKQNKLLYLGLKKAYKTLRTVALNFRRRAARFEGGLIKRVNRDIARINIRMLKRLKDLAENIYLLEVEIYNGASEDVVWQNAHPNYKDFADRLRQRAREATDETVWNWGPSQKNKDGMEEIWIDELGGLTANLNDNCSNKDRYLAITFKDTPEEKPRVEVKTD